MRSYKPLFFLIFISLLSLIFCTLLGNHVFIRLFDANDVSTAIIIHLRLPRVLTAFITGGLLGLSGALMQVLLKNPLADPYILGVSSGAGLFTLLLLSYGITGIVLTGGSWAGAIMAILAVFLFSKKNDSSSQILLVGIALASGLSAVMSLILLLSAEPVLRGMLFWLIGDLNATQLPKFPACILFIGLIISLQMANDLNLLVRGDKPAQALGVNTKRLRWQLYLLSSLLTATAVSMAGCIGFVGLIVPHIIRLMWSYDHRYLLPASVLLGGIILTTADFFSRMLFFPQEIPAGILMILLGVPVFLFLLKKNSHDYVT